MANTDSLTLFIRLVDGEFDESKYRLIKNHSKNLFNYNDT